MSDMLTAEERILVERATDSPLKGLVYRLAERIRVVEAEWERADHSAMSWKRACEMADDNARTAMARVRELEAKWDQLLAVAIYPVPEKEVES